MAKNSYSLDKGFLVPYSQAPVIESMDDVSAGVLLKACIKRQRDGVPFPTANNPVLHMAFLSFESIIQSRLFGQKGGKANEQKEQQDNEKADGSVPPTVPLPYPPTVPKLNQDELSLPNTTSKRGSYSSAKANDEHQKRFDLFWSEYPKKKSKKTALKAWIKIKPDEALTERIISAVKLQKQGVDWQRDNGQYIPHPATWLNGECWNDELPNARERSSIDVNNDEYNFMWANNEYADTSGVN